IRRKHARLFTPRQAKRYEEQEMPRFGIFLADRDEVVLTSDVENLSRREGWDAFTRRVRRWRAAETLQHCPPVLVVTREPVLRLRPAHRARPRAHVHPRRVFFRMPTDAGRIARHLFNAPAPPPAHLGAGERHLAFVVPLAEFGGVERVVCNLARELARQD